MIETQDIRTGNQVLWKTSGSTVTVVKVESDQILLETFPKNSYCLTNEISGIPLTTSLLKKLSFTNEQDAVTWFGEGINIYEKPDGFFYGLRISKNRVKMQYLHELQNYVTDFYALFRGKDHSLNLNSL